ncbi:MAG: hypothetical protein WD232_11265, partial [Acidimicrobiales bacterium]
LGTVAVMAVVIPFSVAWACVGLVVFKTTGSATVQPGGTVEVFGGEFASDQPVDVRLDSPDGPVLATYPEPGPSTMTSRFTLDVPIPDDITPGEHLLVATQEHYDMNGGIPARAVIYVDAPEPPPPTPEERPTSLLASSGPGAGNLVLVGVGAAAVALALTAGAVALRRSSSAPAEGARA